MVLLKGPSFHACSGGYLNVNKPRDWTSTDVVRKLKGMTKVKKIGHGGTLDPLATGVLPVCLGNATRFAETILMGTKEYRLTLSLGTSTNTYDSEGDVTSERDWSGVTREMADAALEQFPGKYEQTPPMFSAVKMGGKRLYELARQGIEVERKARSVEVKQLTLVSWNLPEMVLDVECSHGFYARVLAHELGEALGCGAHLSGLVRTRAGKFKIEESHTLEEIQQYADEGRWKELVVPMDFTLQHLPSVTLDPITTESVQHGQPLPVGQFGTPVGAKPGQQLRAYDSDSNLLAILVFEPEKLGWRPEKVLAAR
ncbi:MAG: tRNA pseudouridine(55) synthase TruB [Chloroflexi bacterium]|nr:tRNA pseudouridine(55) synthase TruB [Chloroflexota bacterium]